MHYLVANWKSHKDLTAAKNWLQTVSGHFWPKELEIILCPPFPFIELLSHKAGKVALGAQTVSPFPLGAYTGAVSADMVAPYVKYAIVGHSERRRYFHETNQDVVNQVEQSLNSGLTPIVCIDEPYAYAQLTALKKDTWEKIIVAYEPLEAIGTGEAQEPVEAQAVIKAVKQDTGFTGPVLYGGSVSGLNIANFVKQPDIDGVLVGTKSLEAVDFIDMINSLGRM